MSAATWAPPPPDIRQRLRELRDEAAKNYAAMCKAAPHVWRQPLSEKQWSEFLAGRS